MDCTYHYFSELFAQLGLSNDNDSIREFISRHKPLHPEVLLPHAQFWTPAQAALLHDEWRADANWVILVDQLDAALR